MADLDAEALEALADVEQEAQVVKEEQHRGRRITRVCAETQHLHRTTDVAKNEISITCRHDCRGC